MKLVRARARLALAITVLSIVPAVASADPPAGLYRGLAPPFEGVFHDAVCSGVCPVQSSSADAALGTGHLTMSDSLEGGGALNVAYANFFVGHDVPATTAIAYRTTIRIHSASTDPRGLFCCFFRDQGGHVRITVHIDAENFSDERTIEIVPPGTTIDGQDLTLDVTFGPDAFDPVFGQRVIEGRVALSLLFEAEAYYNGIDDPTVAEVDFEVRRVGYRLL